MLGNCVFERQKEDEFNVNWRGFYKQVFTLYVDQYNVDRGSSAIRGRYKIWACRGSGI